MTEEKLDQLNEIRESIKRLEYRIMNCKTQKCEWIDFTFGNGSNRSTVTTDFETIEKVRALILEESEKHLDMLKSTFEAL